MVGGQIVTPGAAATATGGGTYRWVVVAVLMLVYIFNFLDRQIMSILAIPIKADLNLSDTQLGMLTGLAFALFYTTLGIPIAWLADRARRTWIIAAACGVWSIFTALCGTAQNFWQLLIFRVGVGAGEAGGSPPSYSLISDYFPAQQRGTALAFYSLGVPIGSALGTAAGGFIAAEYGWRVAFYAVGLPGIALAVLLLLVVREPKRGGMDLVAAPPSPPLFESIRYFFANRTLLLTAVSSGLSAFVGYAMLIWPPQFLTRVQGMTLAEIGLWYALVTGFTSAVGTFGSGWLVDKLGKTNPKWYAWLPAIAFAASFPFYFGFLFAPSWQISLLFLAVPSLVNNMYLAPALAVVQNAVPAGQRTVSGALLLFVLNLIGLGGGPVYVGLVSDALAPEFGVRSVLYGLLAVVPFLFVVVGAHLLAATSIKRLAVGPTDSKREILADAAIEDGQAV